MTMLFEAGGPPGPAEAAAGTTARDGTDEDKAELVDLIRRCQSGDLRAQSDLIRRYHARITGLVRPIVRNGETVKDIVQSVSLKLVRRLPGLREPATFESWLFTLARNTALDEIRRARCRPVSLRSERTLVEFVDPAPADRSGELLEAVQLVTCGWDNRTRRIFALIAAGTSYQSVAEREGLSLGAIKLRVHRLRRDLRERVGALLEGPIHSPKRIRRAFL